MRIAADAACQSLARLLHPDAVARSLPHIIRGTSPSRKWQSKEGAFKMIATLTESAPEAVAEALPELVPVVRGLGCGVGWGRAGVTAQRQHEITGSGGGGVTFLGV